MSTWLDPVPVMSRRMVILLNSLLVAIPLLNLILWSLVGTHFFTVISDLWVSTGYQPLEISTLEGMISPADITWTVVSRCMMLLSKTIQLTPMLIGLFILRLIFKNYKKEIIFSVQNAQYYRWIGGLLLIDTMCAKPLSHLFSSIAAGAHGSGNLIALGFSVTESFVAVLVLVISQVMLEGSRLDEENQLTV